MTQKETMKAVLSAYLKMLWSGASHEESVLYVAHQFANDPWVVVGQVGLLCRCAVVLADGPIGLNERLQVRKAGGKASILDIPAGVFYPVPDRVGRKNRGAFDTPKEMARRLIRMAMDACERPVEVGLDLACGTGTLLLALSEVGVTDVIGYDVDALALQVASVAVPSATLRCDDAFECTVKADVVVGNPPFLSSEKQNPDLRERLRIKFPWLTGRFDVSVPFSAAAVNCCAVGGGLGLILPHAVLVQPYGKPLRERWIRTHRMTCLGQAEPFPGAAVEVALVSMTIGAGPDLVPPMAIEPSFLHALPMCPLGTNVTAADVLLVQKIRRECIPLREVCLVDTGVVAHLPGGTRETLISSEPEDGDVPYADAKEYFRGENRWLSYRPSQMHRAKRPKMFENPKIVVQRIRGRREIRASVDRSGIYLGHTCTVVQPFTDSLDLELLLGLILSPFVDAIMKIERGQTLDLYPKAVGEFPVPVAWLNSPEQSFESALSLTSREREQLAQWFFDAV